MKPRYRLFLFSLAAFVGLVLVAHELTKRNIVEVPYGASGTRDLCAFWSAYQLFSQGENPYDPTALCRVEEQVRGAPGDCYKFLNPPWMLPLLSPVLFLSFPASAIVWFVLNIAMATLAAWFAWRSVSNRKISPLVITALGLVFFPNFGVLYWGQFGLFITLGVACFLWAQRHNHPVIAGLGLVPATIKPHPLYLFFFVLLLYLLGKRQWKTVAALSLSVLGLALFSEWQVSGIINHWLTGVRTGPVFYAYSPVLGDFVRDVASDTFGDLWWVNAVVPLITLVATGGVYFSRRLSDSFLNLIPRVLCLSFITAPYSNVHDFALLLILQVQLVARSLDDKRLHPHRFWIWSTLLAIQLLLFVGGTTYFTGSHHFIWLPLVFLVLLGSVAKRRFSWLLPIGVLFVTLGLTLADQLQSMVHYTSFGTGDFIEYWAAFQQFRNEQNPYDPVALLARERELGFSAAVPLMMWNPPWLLVLMASVLVLPFGSATILWLCANIAFTLLTVFFVVDLERARLAQPFSRLFCWGVIAAVAFYPTWAAFDAGQIGLLLSASLAGVIWALARGKKFLAGCFAAILTVKVHLIYLIGILLFWLAIRTRNHRLVSGGLLSLVALISTSWFVSPQVLKQWREAFDTPSAVSQEFVPVMQWKTATLVSAIRQFLSNEQGVPPAWPMILIPLACAIILVVWLLTQRESINLPLVYWSTLALSLVTTPFGWIFDFAALLPLHIILVLSAFTLISSARVRALITLGLATGLQVAIFVLGNVFFTMHQQFFWVPLAITLLWFLVLKFGLVGDGTRG